MVIEKFTRLVFSMYFNKGAYALLLGAGISHSAHIPSVEEVESVLIKQLAATQGVVNIDDWHQWFEDKYGYKANYSLLLEGLAKEPTERVQLMKRFYEPTTEESKKGWKQTTKAHKAIAKLAKKGYIRVVLTTNFDRLLENALESENVTPQVICHESDIEKSTPVIHSKTVTIIKINGDYIDCRFRNTAKELDSYPAVMKSYVSRIFEDYGLITCGWSAKWDKGLVDILSSSASSRYNSFFTNVGDITEVMKTLSLTKNGEIIPIKGADDLFTDLYEQVTALEKANADCYVHYNSKIERVKEYLKSEDFNTDYSELIKELSIEAYDVIMAEANYNFIITPEQFSHYFELHHNAVKLLIDIAIIAAKWGRTYHIKAFGGVLVKLCTKPFKRGKATRKDTRYLHALGVTLLLNAIGVACVKYERFTELNEILKLKVPDQNFAGYSERTLLELTGQAYWDYDILNNLTDTPSCYPWSSILLERLRSHFKGYYTVDSEFESVFHIWEHLKSLIFGYNQCYKGWFYLPTGQFLHSSIRYGTLNNGNEIYRMFFENANKLKGEWSPIRQGMFGGCYNEYKNNFDQAEEFYNKHMRY